METHLRAKIKIYAKEQKEGFQWLEKNLDQVKLSTPLSFRKEKITLSTSMKGANLIVETTIPVIKGKFEKSMIKDEFEVRLNDLFLALQIAAPGMFEFDQIILSQDEYPQFTTFYNKLSLPYNLWNAIREHPKWFKATNTKTINFKKVWEWLKNIEDYWEEVPESKVGIFLNYLRYFYHDISPMGIAWLVMALESILVTNNQYSKNQIKGRLLELTGGVISEEDISISVRNLYKFRSKIFHGKQILCRPTLLHDGLEKVEKLNIKLYESVSFAFFATIYCLHYMINNKLFEFKGEENNS